MGVLAQKMPSCAFHAVIHFQTSESQVILLDQMLRSEGLRTSELGLATRSRAFI